LKTFPHSSHRHLTTVSTGPLVYLRRRLISAQISPQGGVRRTGMGAGTRLRLYGNPRPSNRARRNP
jgi:hypothetical protein